MLAILSVLYSVLVGLNILDGVSTWKVVKPDNFHRERNPLARWMFSKLGLLRGLIVAELLWIGFISAVFFLLAKHPLLDTVLLALLGVGVLVFLLVVRGNFRTWRNIRQREDLLAKKQSQEDSNDKSA